MQIMKGFISSTDNGMTWELIGSKDYCTRGTIITGPDEMIHIFWVSPSVSPGIYYTKFKYHETPPEPERIYSGYVRSVATGGGYQDISAAVDNTGNIFFAAHFAPADGEVDRVWFMKSLNGGDSWTSPRAVVHLPDISLAYPSLEVNHAGDLVLCFAQHGPAYLGGLEDQDKRIYFTKSTNQGESWENVVQVDSPVGPFGVYNPTLLEDQEDSLYIFAQRAKDGLVMAKSTNNGSTWSGFDIIFPTSDYADPSAAVGSDGSLYVTFRSDLLCGNSLPLEWKNSVVLSSDHGQNWTLVDTNCAEDKVGPAGSMRYANWWNYGGILEWTWEQFLSSDTSIRPVYYDRNTDVNIWDRVTSISLSDSDNDGMPDYWENTYGFDLLNPADAALDYDSDGLSNVMEFKFSTNPLLGDTDGDGLDDGLDWYPLDASQGICLETVRVLESQSIFNSIQTAYDNQLLSDGNTIQTTACVFDENIDFNRDIRIKLVGGSACNFSPITNYYTTVNGSLTISGGSLILKNLIIK